MMIVHLARRELASYLVSPFAWIVSAAFLFINGFFFAAIVGGFSGYSTEAAMYGQDVSIAAEVVAPFVSTLGLLLVMFSPLLTMRSLAEEQSSGSMALLLSSPISSWEIVLGKFAGLLGFWAVLFGVGMAYVPLLLGWFSDTALVPIFVAGGGLLLLAAACSAVGLAASSLSSSQMVAAGISWCVLLFLWIAGFLTDFPDPLGWIGERLGMIAHFEQLTNGLVQSVDLVFFGLLIFLFLLVAQQRVEANRWR